ncbi:MAG TPA: hypothetical protein VIL86_11965, partial [Tepidisphaeraceae bacterium]
AVFQAFFHNSLARWRDFRFANAINPRVFTENGGFEPPDTLNNYDGFRLSLLHLRASAEHETLTPFVLPCCLPRLPAEKA